MAIFVEIRDADILLNEGIYGRLDNHRRNAVVAGVKPGLMLLMIFVGHFVF